MEVTLGGDRLGSGNKQKQEMHEYSRASFNQEQDFKSSMAPGVLYPFLCIPMTNGDSMDIDLDAFVRTLPTKGPLFGSFKLQADIFSIPMRLYQGILHNNPAEIGLKMKDVYFPKLKLTYDRRAERVQGSTDYDWQVNPTALLKYLGLSGIGHLMSDTELTRKINAIPVLGYYDIFKNYYANKQEENAYVITPGEFVNDTLRLNSLLVYQEGGQFTRTYIPYNQQLIKPTVTDTYTEISLLYKSKELNEKIKNSILNNQKIVLTDEEDTAQYTAKLFDLIDDFGWDVEWKWAEYPTDANSGTIQLKIILNIDETSTGAKGFYLQNNNIPIKLYNNEIQLEPFALKNIDDMRNEILNASQFGKEFILGMSGDWDDESGTDESGLPYSALFKSLTDPEGYKINYNSFIQNGLVVKTYQSDIFNNWIRTDWIEGENGINAISAVSVDGGSFEIDALNIANKVYNMLNRIAISGGTYEDWQEAVYAQQAVRKAETPIYEGGMSAEVMFEEVVSSAETNVDNDNKALGSLGGKGTMIGQKGGKNIHIKAREPIFVMGIVSLTPRICYSQGNEWYLTELNSYDDLHKPALDGIGFQDLITEQMAWWDTLVAPPITPGSPDKITRHSAGKIVAWSNYMTAVDKAYGDFAMGQGVGFMALSRNYEIDPETGGLKDCTTYIDPVKYNYAFAYNKLAAQNFWVQIHSKVVTRRKMSAHQIPNL